MHRTTLAEPSDDRKIEMADKKQTRKTSTEQTNATVENLLKFVSIRYKYNAAAVYCRGFVVSHPV